MPEATPKFICPKCKEYIKGNVIDTFVYDDSFRRKRECEECGCRFMTKETIYSVVKRRVRELDT